MLHNQFEALGLKPYGAVPSRRQMDWYRREATAFFHFGVNTFTDLEWGDGTETEKMFNPTELDCRQWMRVIKQAGFTTAILTAKHHDGFCLWPSEYSEHTIAKSPYKEGKGDVVREFVEACHEYGIKPGLYLSPWDRHSKYWGTDAYNTYYNNQLTELMTQYGRIYECWWDGAGSTEAQYDWGRWAYTVRTHQPDCIIFGSLGATEYVEARWVGNESGYAGNPCWATIDQSSLEIENTVELNSGKAGGNRFIPAEVDVSIRPGWFYHESENDHVKPLEKLIEIFYNSVGGNASLLLNIPVDTRGLIHEADVQRLKELSSYLKKTFKECITEKAHITSLHAQAEYPVQHVTTRNEDYYKAPDGTEADTICFAFDDIYEINHIVLEEALALSQRIEKFEILAETEEGEKVIYEGTVVGSAKICKFEAVKTSKICIRVLESRVSPTLRFVGIYTVQ